MGTTLEASPQRLLDHLRRPLPSGRDLLTSNAGHTVNEIVPLGLEAGCGATATSASSCSKAHQDVDSILTFKQAVQHTAEEIVSNTADNEVQHLRDVREPSWGRRGMWAATLGVGASVDAIQSADALARLFWRLKGGGDWDIKLDFDRDYYEIVMWGSTWEVRRDVFGNIHYGAVLDEAGLSKAEATTIAGLGAMPQCPGLTAGCGDSEAVFGANSAADDFAAELGYEVDVGTVAETTTSLYLVFTANIGELYSVSLASGDPAVRCRSGACVGAG